MSSQTLTVEEEGERLCTFFDEDDCRFKFVYGYDEDKEPVVRVQQTLECPPKLDILGKFLSKVMSTCMFLLCSGFNNNDNVLSYIEVFLFYFIYLFIFC